MLTAYTIALTALLTAYYISSRNAEQEIIRRINRDNNKGI